MGRNQHKANKKARTMTMPANMMMNPMAAAMNPMNPLLLHQLASAMMAPQGSVPVGMAPQVESDSSSDDRDDRRASGSAAVAKASSQPAAPAAPLQDGQLPQQALDVTAQNAQAHALQALRDRRAYLFSSVGSDKKIHRGAAMIRNLPKDAGLGNNSQTDSSN